jgi:tetratricopeptide (TPR) repeat protein
MADAFPMGEGQAIARYEGYLRHDPDNPSLLIALGDLYHRSGKFSEALGCYERCFGREPEHPAAMGRIASVMISQHRFEEAERLLRSLTATGEADPALLHNLGLTLYYQKRWSEALERFRQARERGLADAHNVLYEAYALHRLGEVEQAAQACREWLEAHPDTALNGYLAVLEMDSGDMTAANRRAEEVLKQHPDNADAALVAGMWQVEQQQIEQAERHFDNVLQAEPDSPRAWFAKGLVHLYRQEHRAAIAAIETALKSMPGNVGTLVTLAWARFAARDIPGAERTFREAIAADGTFGEAHGGLAVTLILQNRRDEARRAAQVAQRLNPNSLGAVWARGALLALDGKREHGEALVAAALNRPLTADGKTVFDHIQIFMREQAARASPTSKELRH